MMCMDARMQRLQDVKELPYTSYRASIWGAWDLDSFQLQITFKVVLK